MVDERALAERLISYDTSRPEELAAAAAFVKGWLEAREIEDPAALAALDITTRRIAAIAGVHRQLYQAQQAGSVNLAAYLGDLSRALEAGAGRRGDPARASRRSRPSRR